MSRRPSASPSRNLSRQSSFAKGSDGFSTARSLKEGSITKSDSVKSSTGPSRRPSTQSIKSKSGSTLNPASPGSTATTNSKSPSKSPAATRPSLFRRRSSVTFKVANGSKDVPSADEEFLGAIGPQSTKQEVTKLVKLLDETAQKSDDNHKLIIMACKAIVRMCETRKGFNKFLKAQGIDALIKAAQLPQKMGGECAMRASRPICEAACGWMDEVDEVEFTELPDLMTLTRQLGVFDEGVALSALCAMERFGLHRREHAAAMLDAGALSVLHQIINAHRNPELLQDAHILLYRLCDLPTENVLPQLLEELDLIKTISEVMTAAPLNMRLQISGLRLFTLWSKLGDRKVLNAISKTNAQAHLQKAEGDLSRAGFVHAADWLNAVGGRQLAGAVPKAPPGGGGNSGGGGAASEAATADD